MEGFFPGTGLLWIYRETHMSHLTFRLALGLLFVAAAQGQQLRPIELAEGYEHDRFVTLPRDHVREFRAFTTSFDGKDAGVALGVPEWVAYELRKSPDGLGSAPQRPSRWSTDSELHEAGIAPDDDSYRGSGYSRGHMAMKSHAWRLGANADWNSHTVLNACPQLQGMNAGAWLALEYLTADWADHFGRVWIVCGPVFFENKEHKWIGDPGEIPIAVPDAFYKIVIREGSLADDVHVLAFVFPMRGHPSLSSRKADLTPYLTSIDIVEALTDLDFLSTLDNRAQESVEREMAVSLWTTIGQPVLAEREPAPANTSSEIELRSGVNATADETALARQIVAHGWEYLMPRPKSAQARWGNTDGRTTWWNGYWKNGDTGRSSSATPSANDGFAGDGRGLQGWRRGGSPRRPTVIEWLCSKSGGVQPR